MFTFLCDPLVWSTFSLNSCALACIFKFSNVCNIYVEGWANESVRTLSNLLIWMKLTSPPKDQPNPKLKGFIFYNPINFIIVYLKYPQLLFFITLQCLEHIMRSWIEHDIWFINYTLYLSWFIIGALNNLFVWYHHCCTWHDIHPTCVWWWMLPMPSRQANKEVKLLLDGMSWNDISLPLPTVFHFIRIISNILFMQSRWFH